MDILLRVLLPIGPRRAVLLSAVLVGASHLVNLLFLSDPFLVFAQMVGGFCERVGLAAIRLRTNTV